MTTDIQKRIRALRTLEHSIKPDAVWVQATRERLVTQMGQAAPLVQAPVAERAKAGYVSFVQRLGNVMHKPMMAMLSLVLIVAGSSIMSVSAAERSLPGDFLYGLKLATEQARLAWVSSQEDKLKLKTEFTQTRVQELKTVASTKSNDGRVQQVAEILKSDLSTLKDQLSDVKASASPANVVVAAKLVDQNSNEVISALQEAKAGLSPASQQAVTQAQSVAADTGVNAIEVLVEKNQESSTIVAVSDVAEAIQNHTDVVATIAQLPLNISSSTSALDASSTALGASSTTISSLIASIATSTASIQSIAAATGTSVASSTAADASSTASLPQLVNRVKSVTAQVFALQQAQADAQATSTPLIDGQLLPATPASTSTVTGEVGSTSTSASSSSTKNTTSSTTPP